MLMRSATHGRLKVATNASYYAIAKRPGALRSLSHILPLAHIYASGKRSRLTLAIFIQQCLNWGMPKLWSE
jgi:hypothetical protein